MQKNKYIGTAIIYTNQLTRNIEPFLAKLIQQKLKLKIIFIVSTSTDKIYYEKQYPNIFHEIYPHRIFSSIIEKRPLLNNIEKKAVQYEKKYGCSIYKLFFNHRILGRGFSASGGVHHPRNRAHFEGSHKLFMNMGVSEIIFWENLYKKNNIKLAVNLPDYAHYIARKKNLKSLRLFAGRFKNTYAWTSVMGINPVVTSNELKYSKPKNLKKYFLKSPYQSHLDLHKLLLKNLRISNVLKGSIYKALKLIYGKIVGYEMSKNAYITDEVFALWKYRKSYFEYLKYTKKTKKNIKNQKFIFFPLLTEPEVAISGTAKDFFFQLSALNILARDLPADYRILVKEHLLALGRRPKDFYRQISEHKNIVFVDPMKMGLDLIKKCKAVACVAGTAGWEATVMGVPVISFSKYNEFNILEHTFVVKKLDSLREIFNILDKNSYPNKKTLIDGAKFYSAYLKKFVDVKEYNPLLPLEKSIALIPKDLKEVANILFNDLRKKFLSKKIFFN